MGAINLGNGNSKKILEQVHKHKNILVLNDLNDSNGTLTYKDKEIITTSKDSSILATQVIETEDRKFLSKKEKTTLSGIRDNIQSQLDIVKLLAEDSMRFKGRYNSYAEMINSNKSPKSGDTVFIDIDETQNNYKTIYVFTNVWTRIRKDKESNGWTVSSTAPSDRTILWLDISFVEPKLKWFNGTTWVDISGLTTVPANKVLQETNLKFVNDKSDKILNKLTEDLENEMLLYNGKPLASGGASAVTLIKDDIEGLDSTYSSKKINDEINKSRLKYVAENIANKGVANGYAPLNADNKIPDIHMQQYSFKVQSIDEMDNLTTMKPGNTCYIPSLTELYVYTGTTWDLVAKSTALLKGKCNYEATRNPNADDDDSKGYSVGSIWINNSSHKAYVCTNSEKGLAIWELMAGSVTLNIGEIVPFKLDSTNYTINDGKYTYEIPKVNLLTDFIELSVNGHELLKDIDYTISEDDLKTYINLEKELTANDYIFGEIYKHDLKKAEEQMLKSVYDTNNNGKVDYAELSDRSESICLWEKNKVYDIHNMIILDNHLYICTEAHTSGNDIDLSKWSLVITEPKDLNKFTTENLTPTDTRGYVTANQLIDINTIKSITSRVSSNENNISSNSRALSLLRTDANSLKNRLDNIKFTMLTDTPSVLTANGFLKTNSTGDRLIFDTDPLFDIKEIIDSKNIRYRKIQTPKFLNMEMINQTNGQFDFKLDAASTDLKDMPKIYEHGKVLVSDLNNQKYVLADKESLTMSVENFDEEINIDNWTEENGKFIKNVFHNMSSTNLIVSFTNELLKEDKEATYEIIDNKNIKVIANSKRYIKCVINCSLGAGNGYWQYLMDWSKIDFVDDSKIRLDRAYSSSKLTTVLKSYALKNDYYTKNVCDSKYADIALQHNHDNKIILDGLGINSEGDITFKSKRLLTEMKPTTISVEEIYNNAELAEIYDVKTLYTANELQAILGSEIIVKNISTEDITLKITDSNMDVLLVILKPDEVQKYQLGISNKVKVFAKGNIKTMLTVSGF